MPDGNLKIVISADAQAAVSAIKQTTTAAKENQVVVNATEQAYIDAGIAAIKWSNTLTQSAAATQSANVVTKEFSDEIAFFGGGIKNTNTAATAWIQSLKTAEGQLIATTGAVRGAAVAQNTLAQTTGVASTAGAGFIGTISKQRIAFTDLGRVLTGQGFSLRSIASNFALFPPILVITAAAIGGVIYLLTRKTDAEKRAAEATIAHKKAVDELVFSFSDSTRVQDKATADTQGQIAQVQALAAVAENANKPYAERKRALQELKEINKSYFGDLSLEADKLGLLKKAVDDYTQAIVQQAVIKGFSEEISKVAVAMSTQQKEVDKAKTKYEQLSAASKQLSDDQKKVQSAVIGGSGLGVSTDIGLTTVAIGKAAAAQKDFTDKRTDLEKLSFQYADLQDEIKKAVDQSLKLKDLQTPKGSPDAALNKEIEALKKEIAALEQLQKQGDITRVELERLFTLKIKLIQIELPKTKLTADQAGRLITDLQNQADAALSSKPMDLRIKLGNIITGLPGDANQGDVNAALKKVFDTTTAQKTLSLTPKATIRPELILDTKGINLKKLKTQFAGLGDNISKIAQKTIQDGLANIGTVIGDAISGTNLKDGLSAFATILGEGLIEIGKMTIQYAIAIDAIKKAINALIKTPGGVVIAIGLGIAAIALGTVLKNKVSETKAFAEGGIVTGPTNALIGERGPEVVFPLNQLNKFIGNIVGGGNNEPIILGTALRGDDIWIQQQRVARRKGRV